MRLLIFCLLWTLLSPAHAQRLVSLNLCIDQMLLRFAPREQIASLTYFAGKPQMSPLAAQAQGIAQNHGLVEEVIPLAPTRVLVGEYGAREAAQLLQNLGYQVERVPLPYALDDIEAHLNRFAQLLNQPPALVAYREQWQTRRDALEQQAAATSERQKPWALMLGPNNVAPAKATLEHQLLTLAGFRNWAARSGKQGFINISLEQLVMDPPDLVIVDRVAAENFSLAHEVLRHPALAAALARGRVASLPGNLTVCPAPNINQLLSALVELRQALSTAESP